MITITDFSIRREEIDVSVRSEPDPNWQHEASDGVVFRWLRGPGGVWKLVPFEPTVVVVDEWIDEEGEEREIWEYRYKGELVVPGYRGGSRYFTPGPLSWEGEFRATPALLPGVEHSFSDDNVKLAENLRGKLKGRFLITSVWPDLDGGYCGRFQGVGPIELEE